MRCEPCVSMWCQAEDTVLSVRTMHPVRAENLCGTKENDRSFCVASRAYLRARDNSAFIVAKRPLLIRSAGEQQKRRIFGAPQRFSALRECSLTGQQRPPPTSHKGRRRAAKATYFRCPTKVLCPAGMLPDRTAPSSVLAGQIPLTGSAAENADLGESYIAFRKEIWYNFYVCDAVRNRGKEQDGERF